MLNSKPVLVEMSPHDAALFVLFQQYYHSFGFMVASGIFDLKNGNATLNFDSAGNLKSIEKKIYTYSTEKT